MSEARSLVAAGPAGNAPVESTQPVGEDTRAVLQRAATPVTDAVLLPTRTPHRRLPWRLLVFLLVVVAPTLLSAFYFFGVASDQYVAESRFGIRSAEPARNDVSSLLTGGSAAGSQIGLDSNVVVQFVQSREAVDLLEQQIGFRTRYERADVDEFSRLKPGVSAEDVVMFWRAKVDPFFDTTTGSISLRVKAFTPEDALLLNQEILRLSEILVNDMSRRSREDGVKLAREEVAKAADRLRATREKILDFRDKERLLDPKRQSEGPIGLIAKLREDLARVTAEISTNRAYMKDNAPSMTALVNRQRGLQEQIQAAERQLTSFAETSTNDSYSRTLGGFDALESERLIAEKAYASSIEAAQRAQETANRQATYLAVFVKPSLPEAALYPRRIQAVILTALAATGFWILLLIAVYSIREHA